jgi:hypothetical protein
MANLLKLLKCYTAEEIGEAVGLQERQAEREVSDISESFLKSPKVQFSEPDWSPPIPSLPEPRNLRSPALRHFHEIYFTLSPLSA